MLFVSSPLGLLTTRLLVGLGQFCMARPSYGLGITIRHPGMIQYPFTWLKHCPLASGDIEINSKCCGLNFGLVLVDSRWQGQFLEGFSLEFLEEFFTPVLGGNFTQVLGNIFTWVLRRNLTGVLERLLTGTGILGRMLT
jgi:hypothetical protein